jgi:hypothetical protein
MELDDLLADLQSVIPDTVQPERTSSGRGQYGDLPALPGAEDREIFEIPPGYDAPAMTPPSGDEEFDDDAYSTVTHKPRYVPKNERGSSPPPAKPRRTDRPEYDTTTAFRREEPKLSDGGGGLDELDNLLAMLSDTQQKAPSNNNR